MCDHHLSLVPEPFSVGGCRPVGRDVRWGDHGLSLWLATCPAGEIVTQWAGMWNREPPASLLLTRCPASEWPPGRQESEIEVIYYHSQVHAGKPLAGGRAPVIEPGAEGQPADYSTRVKTKPWLEGYEE